MRREVRVADAFFEELDRQFGPDRGPNGESSGLRLPSPNCRK
jgi:hypothetical protein